MLYRPIVLVFTVCVHSENLNLFVKSMRFECHRVLHVFLGLEHVNRKHLLNGLLSVFSYFFYCDVKCLKSLMFTFSHYCGKEVIHVLML